MSASVRWWPFLSGLPEASRRRRLLVPIQAFVDDSGGKGTSAHFVLAALAGHSESWMHFSDEWNACLRASPAISYFKMREAASCGGQFYGMDADTRDTKLRSLCRIINRHARLLTCSVIDLSAHAETWASLSKPTNDPYSWPFHNSIMVLCFSLWNFGWRERFEIIFDEDLVFGPRAKLWYPVVRAVVQHREPDAASILPADPLFRTDDEFLPIQAADLFAWCIRKKHDSPSFDAFDWVFDEMPRVELSEYVQYYDKARMSEVMAESYRIAASGEIPDTVTAKWNEIYGR